MRFTTSLLLVILLLEVVTAANILVYNPSIGVSHSNFFNKISDILVTAGHNVTQLRPIFNKSFQMGTTKAQVIEEDIGIDTNAAQITDENSVTNRWLEDGTNPWSFAEGFKPFWNLTAVSCDKMINNDLLLERLRTHNFELAISEPFDTCQYGLFHILNISTFVTAKSMFMIDRYYQYMGVPTAPSYVPAMSSFAGTKMSFRERMYNVNIHFGHGWGIEQGMLAMEEVYRRKFNGNFPLIRDLMAESTFIFTNTDRFLDYPHPTLQKVVDIGGITIPPKSSLKLEKKWNRILDLRPKTVLISFGSIYKSSCLPEKWKATIQRVTRRFTEVTFIWKYEVPEDKIGISEYDASSEGDNLITTTWMPQLQLLNDRRVTGFVTHAGAGGVNEGSVTGVPMLLIPASWDQYRYARMVERTGNGICFAKENLESEESFYKALKEFIYSEKLLGNARRVEEMIANRPFTPRETFLKHIGFAIKYGPLPQMIPDGRNLSYFQYFLIDIILFMSVSFVITVTILFKILRKIYRTILEKQKND